MPVPCPSPNGDREIRDDRGRSPVGEDAASVLGAICSSIGTPCAGLRREKYEAPGRTGYDLEEKIGADSFVGDDAGNGGGLVMGADSAGPFPRIPPFAGSRRCRARLG